MRQLTAVAAACALCLAGTAAGAGDGIPGPLRPLIDELRESARQEPAPPATALPASYSGICHTLVRSADIEILIDETGRVNSVAGAGREFGETLGLKPSAGGERSPFVFTDRHGAHWDEGGWTAEIVRAGGRRPRGRIALVPRHTGYLLAWPEEAPRGCAGKDPIVTVLEGPYSLELAHKLLETETFARENRGTQPTAKPRGGDGPPQANPKG